MLQTNIGAYVKPKSSVHPQSSAAATVNGINSLDRQGYQSCSVVGSCGAATGTPTTQSVTFKLQDSADGTTGFADVTGAAAAALTADNTLAEIEVDLTTVKRFIRVVATVAFTGGSTPAIPISGVIVLGGAMEQPA